MSEREDVEMLAVYLAKAQIEPLDREWRHLGNMERERLLNHARTILDSDWLAVHDELVRTAERVRLAGEVEALDDAVCSCIMAARWGKYDGRTVESHLSSLLDDVRALVPVPGVRLTEEE